MSKFLLLVALILQPSISLSAEFLAGTAKADITPPVGGLMYGYGARGTNVSTGVHDPLYAKAIVLDDGTTKLTIVALDLGSISGEESEGNPCTAAEPAPFCRCFPCSFISQC